MNSLEQIKQQSNLVKTALILGARYEEPTPQTHALTLACGIRIDLRWLNEIELVFSCAGWHSVEAAFDDPRSFARKIQSYIWVISKKWDELNHPQTNG